jgi:UDP:flavonoid glycosyltransferase YjiC (YdhE family)
MVGIALGMKGRGHEVVVATNGHFESLVRGVGLEFISTGTDEEFREVMADRSLWDPIQGFRTVMERGVLRGMRKTYEIIREGFDPGETVIVGAGIAFAGRVAQEREGYRLATVQLQPAALRSVYENPVLPGMWMPRGMPRWMKGAMWRLADWAMVDRVLKGPLNAFRGEVGLGALRGGVLREWWNSPELVLGLWPEWFGPVQGDWPGQVRLVGFPLFDEGKGGPAARPLSGGGEVVFTPGSANVHGREFFEESVEACGILGKGCILLTRHGEQVPGDLPGWARHVEYAPFSELLPGCAAMVHHGGIGTTAQGLRAGCRQVIMPWAHDQPDNAARVERLGVGRTIWPKRYRAKEVARVLGELIASERVTACCREVAGRFVGVDAVGAACGEIEKLMGR